jgi:hypothetical protein
VALNELPQAWLDLAADLRVTLGNVSNRLDQERRLAMARIPSDVQLVTTGVCGATGTLILQVSKPDPGRLQEVRLLTVGGASATDTPAGTAYAYIRGDEPTDLGLTGLFDETGEPFVTSAQYGTHQVVVRFPDALWVAIVGGTEGNIYTVTGKVEDFDERAYAGIIE